MERDELNIIHAFNPATFVERGVSLPFTAPLLAGTRVRSATGGIELVVPNPAGGKGCYILNWPSARTLCRPTVHDHKLMERIVALATITPEGLRDAARAVAREGFAGREAAHAAVAADEQVQRDRMVVGYRLLAALIVQAGKSGLVPQIGSAITPAEMEAAAARTMAGIAPRLGVSRDAIAAALEGLSAIYSPIGLTADDTAARMPTLLAALQGLRADMEAWSEQGHDDTKNSARMIGAVADMTRRCARVVIERAREELANPLDLLRRWLHEPNSIDAVLSRPDWVVDGWDAICRLWRSASNNVVRRERLDEIARLMPPLPKEIIEWTNVRLDLDMPFRRGRTVIMGDEWRTGARIIELTARNEALLAAALRDRAREAASLDHVVAP